MKILLSFVLLRVWLFFRIQLFGCTPILPSTKRLLRLTLTFVIDRLRRCVFAVTDRAHRANDSLRLAWLGGWLISDPSLWNMSIVFVFAQLFVCFVLLFIHLRMRLRCLLIIIIIIIMFLLKHSTMLYMLLGYLPIIVTLEFVKLLICAILLWVIQSLVLWLRVIWLLASLMVCSLGVVWLIHIVIVFMTAIWLPISLWVVIVMVMHILFWLILWRIPAICLILKGFVGWIIATIRIRMSMIAAWETLVIRSGLILENGLILAIVVTLEIQVSTRPLMISVIFMMVLIVVLMMLVMIWCRIMMVIIPLIPIIVRVFIPFLFLWCLIVFLWVITHVLILVRLSNCIARWIIVILMAFDTTSDWIWWMGFSRPASTSWSWSGASSTLLTNMMTIGLIAKIVHLSILIIVFHFWRSLYFLRKNQITQSICLFNFIALYTNYIVAISIILG